MRKSFAALAVVLLAGCSAATSPPPTSEGGSAASSASPDTPAPARQSHAPEADELTGVLDADPIEGGCPYLRAEDGTRYEVVYPPGWSIDRSSATLRDPSGTVVASAGDVITIRGREAKDRVSFCQIGPIFEASEVVSVE